MEMDWQSRGTTHTHAPVGVDDLVPGAKSEGERRTALPAILGDTEEACTVAELVTYDAGKGSSLCGKRAGTLGGTQKKRARALVVAGMSSVAEDGQEELGRGVRVRRVVCERPQDAKRVPVIAL